MAKVSLRTYNREIETMIEQDHLEEAVAHCRHILQTYPKHLETYRLLGKAYLEAKRYPEAADIFQRVLMASPGDFVSHVGMSIIRDNGGDLDEAIWHMQRAFEVQPSNAAIQGELQRLYGRRDGVQPPKIRLTRGALAYMYLQGNLYPQAIAEVHSVLEGDPQRVDMQNLLALTHYRAGQQVKAVEACTKLLERYPYCLDANRIMAAILPGTERAESAKLYRDRLQELDPYTSFVTGSVFLSSGVPDMAVSLERLEWSPGRSVEMRPEWARSLGIGLGSAAGEGAPEQPEPAASQPVEGEPSTAEPPAPSEEPPQGESLIPDWLREAGWSEATDEAPEGPLEEEGGEAGLAEAEIPDWVQSMAPQETESGPVEEESPEKVKEATIDESQIPDWLKEATPEQPQASKETQPLTPSEGGLSEEPEQPAPSVETPIDEEALKDELGTNAKDQNEALAWLEGLAAKRGAKSEELITSPEERPETPPEWVRQAQTMDEGAEPESAKTAELPSQPDQTDQWLHTLAEEDRLEESKEATESAEVEAESLPQEDVPDWLKGVAPAPSESAAEAAPSEESPGWLRGIQAAEQGPPPPAASEARPPSPEKLDLNAATQEQLAELPGIGELLAGSILAYRETSGGFSALEDLQNVSGIDEHTLEALRNLVSVGGAQPPAEQEAELSDIEKWLEDEAQPLESPEAISPAEWQSLGDQESPPETPAPVQAEPELGAQGVEAVEPTEVESTSSQPEVDATLAQAQAQLGQGQLADALESYGALIKKGNMLNEVIDDLHQALDRFPIEVPLWQTLGDAYLRANHLQDALDAYTKAEELLR